MSGLYVTVRLKHPGDILTQLRAGQFEVVAQSHRLNSLSIDLMDKSEREVIADVEERRRDAERALGTDDLRLYRGVLTEAEVEDFAPPFKFAEFPRLAMPPEDEDELHHVHVAPTEPRVRVDEPVDPDAIREAEGEDGDEDDTDTWTPAWDRGGK